MDIENILSTREKTHGEFEHNSLFIQDCKDIARANPAYWEHLPPTVRESIDMILHKLGRVIYGDYEFKDHWLDIQGYAQLIIDEIENKEQGHEKHF